MRKWLKRLFSKRDRGNPSVEDVNKAIEAMWEGTPYLESLAFMRMMAQGKDKTEIVAAASEYFDMAREARKRGNLDAMTRTLCLALAGFFIAADLYDAAAALGNLGMVYEKKGEFAIAARLQRQTLAMKHEIGMQGEPISRSHWLIGRAEAGLGNYAAARVEMQTAFDIVQSPEIRTQLAWVEQRIAANVSTGGLPPD